MIRLRVLAALLLLGLLTSCDLPAPPAPPALPLIINWTLNGLPASSAACPRGAYVDAYLTAGDVESPRATSARAGLACDRGSYEFGPRPPGRYTVHLHLFYESGDESGRVFMRSVVDVVAGARPPPVNFDFVTTPRVNLRWTLNGLPASSAACPRGAYVDAYLTAGDVESPRATSARAGLACDRGSYEFGPRPPGRYTVHLHLFYESGDESGRVFMRSVVDTVAGMHSRVDFDFVTTPLMDAGTATDGSTADDAVTPTDIPPTDTATVTDRGPVTDGGASRLCATLTAPGVCRPGVDPGCTVTSLAAYRRTACALISDGSVRCWGPHRGGPLGLSGTPQNCAWPGLVPTITGGVTQLAVGDGFACAQRSGMGTWCWGRSAGGRLGTGDDTPDRDIPARNLVTITEGRLYAGSGNGCVVSATRAECWGDNGARQLGSALATLPEHSTPVVVAGLAGAASVAIGGSFGCADFPGGSVSCWGDNTYGQAGQDRRTPIVNSPTPVMGISGVRQTVAGSFHACALRSDGRVLCWGHNENGQLGRGGTTPGGDPMPQAVLSITDARGLVAALDSTCALRADGTVWCWGASEFLGDGSTADRGTPAMVPGLGGVLALTGGGPICALLGGVEVRCWGSNPGNGTSSSRTPVRVEW